MSWTSCGFRSFTIAQVFSQTREKSRSISCNTAENNVIRSSRVQIHIEYIGRFRMVLCVHCRIKYTLDWSIWRWICNFSIASTLLMFVICTYTCEAILRRIGIYGNWLIQLGRGKPSIVVVTIFSSTEYSIFRKD